MKAEDLRDALSAGNSEGPPSTPNITATKDAQWEQINAQARADVVLYWLVSVVARGIDRETALMGTVLWLAAERRTLMAREVDRLMNEPSRFRHGYADVDGGKK